jgi:YYY domain-containing protein
MKSNIFGLDSILSMGLSIGFLYPLNTWDYPVYLIITIIVFAYQIKKKDYLVSFASIATMAAASYLLYLPYHLSYKIDKTILLVPSGRTSLIFYLAIYGLFLFLIYTFVLNRRETVHPPGRSSGLLYFLTPPYKNLFKLSFILLIIAALITIFEVKLFIFDGVTNPKTNEFELLILLMPLLVLSVISIFKETDKNNVFILILIIAGVFTSLFCEFFYIQDALGSGNPIFIRLNTVFKMYLQNWILWAISAGYIVFLFRYHFTPKKAWGVAAVLLILFVSIYPVFATIGKSGGFSGIPELDGGAYVKKEHPGDYQAILWFMNLTGRPVVLQAPGELYEWNSAITTFSGLPTVIGWAGHELNWRFPKRSEIDMRWSDAGRMYTSGDIREVEALLIKYDVSYVYFGEAEAKRFGNPRLFEENPDMFEKVFEYGDAVIYKFSPNR